MKKFNTLVLLFTTIVFTPNALASEADRPLSDSEEYTTIGVHELDREHIGTIVELDDYEALYQRFERHFGDYIGDNAKPVDYDFIMGKKSSLETFELREWYLRAMEAGMPLQRFNRFGIIQQGNGKYVIHYDENPHLARTESLHNITRFPRAIKEQLLLPLGFRQSDIDIIEDYVVNHDLSRMVDEAGMEYFDQIFEEMTHNFSEKAALPDRQLIHILNATMYSRTYVRYKVTRNWMVGLMRQFDKPRQRILKQLTAGRVKGTSSGTNHPHNLLNPEVINVFRSGAFKQVVMEYRQKKQQQIDALLEEVK